MPTYTSGTSAYCTPDQFLNYADVRTVCQLLSDENAALTSAQVLESPTLAAMLQRASGLVEAAVIPGGRYQIQVDASGNVTRNDLASLVGNSKEMLAGIVADLTVWLLWKRRPTLRGKGEIPAQAAEAVELLEHLRKGEELFGVLDNAQAGTVVDVVEDAATVEKRLDMSVAASRLFGRRLNRLNG